MDRYWVLWQQSTDSSYLCATGPFYQTSLLFLISVQTSPPHTLSLAFHFSTVLSSQTTNLSPIALLPVRLSLDLLIFKSCISDTITLVTLVFHDNTAEVACHCSCKVTCPQGPIILFSTSLKRSDILYTTDLS